MNVLMDICGQLAAGAPTGMKEYIEFNLAADKAVTLVDQYAEDIEDALMEIDKIISENSRREHTTQDGHNFGKGSKTMDQYIWGNSKDW
ncbi:MAG: hypothetical protein JXR78_09560 [Victivallales bacterium]|nr:hypothetical protein [Victivallales bacterium]